MSDSLEYAHELADLRDQLAARDAEIIELRKDVSYYSSMEDPFNQTIELAEQSLAELRADVVYAVEHGASNYVNGGQRMIGLFEGGDEMWSVDYDGTDAGLLAAIRRARLGEAK